VRRRHFGRSGALASIGLALAGFAAPNLAAPAGAASTSGSGIANVPAGTQVAIKLATYLPDLGTPATNALNAMVQGFETAHPNIHVSLETEPVTTQGAISAQVQQDAVVGQTPDIVQVGFAELRNIVKIFGGVDLTNAIGDAGLATEWGGTYRYAPAVTQLGKINGDVYGIPWTLSTPMLFYNADLFRKAGLNPSDPPTTWAEVKTDALAIKSATGASGLENGCIGASAGGADWCLQAMIDSAGGAVMNAKQSKTTFTDPKLITAMDTLQQLGSSGAMVDLSNAQTVQAWGAGQLAMVLNSSAIQTTLLNASKSANFTMMAAKQPGFGKLPTIATNSGSAMVMLSKSHVQREADWELMKWLTSPASETSITENMGYVPLRPSIADSSQYLQSWAYANSFLSPNLYQLEHIKPWEPYPGPNFVSLQSTLVNAATSIAFQNANPAVTMATAQAQASALVK
jgi:multiple sugar transport system substrate-binding protein